MAVTLQPADRGDTTSMERDGGQATWPTCWRSQDDPATEEHVHEVAVEEVVADKGYHSNETLEQTLQAMAVRSYVSEPARGKRNWKGKARSRAAVYANRRRIRGAARQGADAQTRGV